jgi:carotenoid cleavage dioxygenase
MGATDDGKQVIVDVESSLSNPFPFMPYHDGSRWDPVKGGSIITRFSADLTKKTPKNYGIDVLFPGVLLPLPRQDDRYTTAHDRYGFGSVDWMDGGARKSGIARFDVWNRTKAFWQAPQGTALAEICHAPKSATAPEGAGYVMAVATHPAEAGRADLLILDAEHVEDGPVATVKLPTRAVGQVHGYWVAESHFPTKA